jgi:hypothetical protein
MHIYICRHANSFSSASFFSSIIIFPHHSEEEEIKIERGVVSHQYKIYYRAEKMKCEGRRRMKERKKEEEERPQNQN